jgi:hypothetical protein
VLTPALAERGGVMPRAGGGARRRRRLHPVHLGQHRQPKGVALTHANLLANIRAMAQAIEATPRDVFVSWLPLYHDMGLIGAWLGSLRGLPLVVMSPLAFLARPGAGWRRSRAPRHAVGRAELRLRAVPQAHRRRGARRARPVAAGGWRSTAPRR